MFVIEDSIEIPIERCFLLSTSIELVAHTLGMKPVGGKTSGLIADRDRVDWRGWKFGLPQHHETLITAYDPPIFFQDSMAGGRFQEFSHDHKLTAAGAHTLLEDTVRFSVPFGSAGAAVGRLVLVPHIHGLLRQRFALLKRIAESPSEEWRIYLPES